MDDARSAFPLLETGQAIDRKDILLHKPREQAFEVGQSNVVGGGSFGAGEKVNEVISQVGSVPCQWVSLEEELENTFVVLHSQHASALGPFE